MAIAVINYGTSYVIALVTVIAMGQFYDAMMPRRKLHTPFWAVMVAYALLCLLLWALTDGQYVAKQAFNVMWTCGFALLGYRASAARKMFSALLFYVLVILLDAAVGLMMVALSGRPTWQMQKEYFSFLFGACITHLLLVTVCIAIKRAKGAKNAHQPLSFRAWARLLVFPLASAIVMLSIDIETVAANEITPAMVCGVLALLLANIVVLLIADDMEKEQEVRQENRLLEQQVKMEIANVRALMEVLSSVRGQSHEYKNRISTLELLLANGENETAKRYLAALERPKETGLFAIYTNNPVADAVLNLKHFLAKKQGVTMTITANDAAGLPLKDEELVTVLANLLDNAIEACAHVPANPEIQVQLVCGAAECVLSVHNTVAKPVEVVDGEIHTSKPNARMHGYGLKNVAAVLARHQFPYAIDCRDGWFQFTAVMEAPAFRNMEPSV